MKRWLVIAGVVTCALAGLAVLAVQELNNSCIGSPTGCVSSVDPDLPGGWLWFRDASQEDRLAHYRAECVHSRHHDFTVEECIADRIASKLNTVCLNLHSPTLKDPEVDARFDTCMTGAWLTQ